ncbi:Golgi transport complex subunit 5-domain-containing protein [Vararia minispora EC-137]|uniref:Golgi transport complex subunit 5-domain-containing protein n=1 Tax=Vararia minispora EC-137 TaxID=1314806 RepID=A0ACB8QYD2_9AGAM|nr:Golgi transport complex subunit 5-domain-containing protein [Vararia minispora EC-137]
MADHSVFALADFDANDYANAILAGESYPPQPGVPRVSKPPGIIDTAREDISVAIGKLDTGIEDVSRQIKNVVTVHHEDLLIQAASLGDLESSFGSVRSGLDELDTSLDKLRQKIRVPYQSMQTNVVRLQRLRLVSDALRRTSRFVLLAKRLQTQMAELGDESTPDASKPEPQTNGTPAKMSGRRSATPGLEIEGEKERTLAQAALSVAELNDLLETALEGISIQDAPETTGDNVAAADSRISLHSINAVASYIPFVEASHSRITSEMEMMIKTGLADTNRSLLATSLQTAHNLHVLPEFVQDLVADLSAAVESRIKTAFDVSRISKELLAKDSVPPNTGVSYKSRIRTEPTSLNAPQWTNALWARLTSLVEDMTGACIKVYTLENVLKIKKDPVSQVLFLDEAMKVLENKPSTTFWTALGRSLEKQCRDAAKNSTFIQQTLSAGYPRLLRLFNDFFSKIAAHTDTVYTQTQQSTETILVLRALSSFETLYLARVSNRLNEAVGQAFQSGTRSPPGLTEGINISRTVANELDSAKFDPLLLRAVASSIKTSLDGLLSRFDGLVSRDRSANTVSGPTATPQLISNAALATFAYSCSSRLNKLEEEYPDTVYSSLSLSVKQLQIAYERVVDPLLGAIKRELSAIIAKIHVPSTVRDADSMEMGGSSPYVKELTEKLNFIKTEILCRFNIEDVTREWTITIVRYIIKIFVLHASIVKPLDEARKLQLTNDMTELEFSLSSFLIQSPLAKRGGSLDVIGEDYKTLRAMRPLLFLDNQVLASSEHTMGLSPLIVLHHILVRSPISLPHALHGWLETEYVRWLEEHSEEEALTLIDGGLMRWESVTESEGTDPSSAVEYVQLARAVLANARRNS